MARLRIVNDFLKMSDADLIAKASNVNSGLTNNINFPDTAADVVILNTTLINFDAAVIAASSNDSIKIALKNNLKADLKTILRKLSSTVTHSAPADDKAVWLSSGFTISGDNNNATVTIGTPQNFTVEVGKVSGQATLRCDRIPGARYIFLYAPPGTAADTWQLGFSENNNNELTISGLTLLVQYSFRIVVVGPKGQHEYSEIILKMVI